MALRVPTPPRTPSIHSPPWPAWRQRHWKLELELGSKQAPPEPSRQRVCRRSPFQSAGSRQSTPAGEPLDALELEHYPADQGPD